MSKYRTLKYPPSIFWEVTPLCNHNCVHCFNYWRTDITETKELNENYFSKSHHDFSEKIVSLHPVQVIITGGEPLLVWEAVKNAIETFLDNGIHVSMNTNATLMTDEIASFLADKIVKIVKVLIYAWVVAERIN